jgi:tetratricopeptide (TPR) repeat protein
MSYKSEMQYPKKDRNNVIKTESAKFLQNHIPHEWVVNVFEEDFGTDFHCEISTNGEIRGDNFTIQLKGKEYDYGKAHVTFRNIKRTTINRWLTRLEPTMLVGYIVKEKKAYWTWITDSTFDLSKPNKHFQIDLSRELILDALNWEIVVEYVENIFAKRHLLYQIPKKSKSAKETEAWELYFENDFSMALPLLRNLVKECKDDALVLNAIAVCEYELIHFQQALSSINQALMIEVNDTLLLNKGSILAEFGQYSHNQQMVLDSLEIFKNLLESTIEESLIQYNCANAWVYLKQDDVAIAAFQRSLELNPSLELAWKNLGSAYSRKGRYIEEMDCYEKALRINPNLVEALFSKGLTLHKIFGKVREGLELMKRSVNLDDSFALRFPSALLAIANGYLDLGENDEAEKWNQIGLSNNPGDSGFESQKIRIQKLRKSDL